jgi:hypothetical protein
LCEGVLEKSYFLEVGKITLFAEALVSALACGALAMCVMWVEYLKNVRWVKYKKDKIENRLSSPINISFLVFSQWSILVLSSVFCFFTLGGNERRYEKLPIAGDFLSSYTKVEAGYNP